MELRRNFPNLKVVWNDIFSIGFALILVEIIIRFNTIPDAFLFCSAAGFDTYTMAVRICI